MRWQEADGLSGKVKILQVLQFEDARWNATVVVAFNEIVTKTWQTNVRVRTELKNKHKLKKSRREKADSYLGINFTYTKLFALRFLTFFKCFVRNIITKMTFNFVPHK